MLNNVLMTASTPVANHAIAIELNALFLIALGVVLLVFPETGAMLFNLVYFYRPVVEVAPEIQRYIFVAHGVLGAVMIGWMGLIIFITRGPFCDLQPWAWKSIALSVGVWYCSDTTFSFFHNAYGNVLLNTVAVIGFVIPLAMSRRYFAV